MADCEVRQVAVVVARRKERQVVEVVWGCGVGAACGCCRCCGGGVGAGQPVPELREPVGETEFRGGHHGVVVAGDEEGVFERARLGLLVVERWKGLG